MPISGRRPVRPDGGLYRQMRRREKTDATQLEIFAPRAPRPRSWLSKQNPLIVLGVLAILVIGILAGVAIIAWKLFH